MKPKIHSLLFSILILFCTFNTEEINAQDIKVYTSTETINDFLESHKLKFDEVQMVFLNEVNGVYKISNGEAFGIPQNNSRNVVVFYSNPNFDLKELKIIKNSNETFDFIEGMSIDENNLMSLSIKIFNQSFEIKI